MDEEKKPDQGDLITRGIALFNTLPIGTLFVSGTIMFLLGLGLNGWQTWQPPAEIHFVPAEPTPTPLPTSTPEPVNVFINGEVAEPGIYQLPFDARVQELIALAGGFTTEAFADVVNLAQPLTDGMHVYVPAVGDEQAVIPLVSTPPSTTKAEGESAGGLIDINRANKSQLETLPGVGPSTAEKILIHREDNGPFASIEAIMDVSGIGPAKFEKMADFITVNE